MKKRQQIVMLSALILLGCETTSDPEPLKDYTSMTCKQLLAEKEIAVVNLKQAEIIANTAANQQRHANPYGANNDVITGYNQGVAARQSADADRMRKSSQLTYAATTREMASRSCE